MSEEHQETSAEVLNCLKAFVSAARKQEKAWNNSRKLLDHAISGCKSEKTQEGESSCECGMLNMFQALRHFDRTMAPFEALEQVDTNFPIKLLSLWTFPGIEEGTFSGVWEVIESTGLGTPDPRWSIRRVMATRQNQKLDEWIRDIPSWLLLSYGRSFKFAVTYCPAKYEIGPF